MVRFPRSWRRRRRGLAIGAAVSAGLLTAAGVVVPAPASAATITVCNTGSADYTSITAAVVAAAPGDTITVCAGTFTEPAVIDVDKALTLLGAQNGVDARTRSGAPETILNSPAGGLYVTSPGVRIDGFSFTDQTENGKLNSAIATLASATIVNNIFARNAIGMFLNTPLDPQSPDPPTTLVQHNLFDSNNYQSGGGQGNGIYSDAGLRNAVIDQNRFVGNENASVLITSTTAAVADISITNNLGDNQIVLLRAARAEVRGNRILDSASHGLHLGGDTSDVTATGNWFVGQARYGVRIQDLGVGPNTRFEMHGNCIAHSGWAGIEQEPGSYTGTVNAVGNWWGASNGPAATSATTTRYQDGRWVDTATGEPFDDDPAAGWGDPLSGAIDQIDASGFLTAPTGAPCPRLPTLRLDGSARLTEGDAGTRQMRFPVTMNAPYYLRARFGYATSNGTAKAGSDYRARSGTVTLDAGDTTVPDIAVPIIGDRVPERTERFTVSLSAPINAGFGRRQATGVIRDTDARAQPRLHTRTARQRIGPGHSLSDRVHVAGLAGGHQVQAVARLYGPFASRTHLTCAPRHLTGQVRWQVDNGWNRSPAVQVRRPGFYTWQVSTRADQNHEAAEHRCGQAAETTLAAKPGYPSPIVDGGFSGTVPERSRLRAALPVLGIPDIGLHAGVRPVGIVGDRMQLPGDVDTLGWLTKSAEPGDSIGTSVVAGHVSDRHDTPGAMWNLRHVRQGALITLGHTHQQHRYRVTAQTSYPRDQRLPHRLFTTTHSHRLVLITCTDRQTYPNGHFHYARYLVVVAHPVHPRH